MENLTEEQCEDIKKISTSRFKLKLLTVGDKDMGSFDRPTSVVKWAELISRGVDQPVPATPQSVASNGNKNLRWDKRRCWSTYGH